MHPRVLVADDYVAILKARAIALLSHSSRERESGLCDNPTSVHMFPNDKRAFHSCVGRAVART